MTAPRSSPAPALEHRASFACFGAECTVIVADAAREQDAAAAVADAKRRLLAWHRQFSRFEPDSELSRLNRDADPVVAISPLMRRILDVARRAAHDTGGLVDATLCAEIERAGYSSHFEGTGLRLDAALARAPSRAPASPNPAASWRLLSTDRRSGTVSRPPGLRFDVSGIAKGVFADELATLLGEYGEFAVDCAGDLWVGGHSAIPRAVHLAGPFDESTLHTFVIARGGVATSGIGRRSRPGADGGPAHHLLDPGTSRPAFTGVVQATALAPTAAERRS